MNLNDALLQVANTYGLNYADLVRYTREDEIGGYHSNPAEAKWPMGSIWGVEGQILYALVRAIKPQRVIELGTYYGCSTAHIGYALLRNEEETGQPPQFITVDGSTYEFNAPRYNPNVDLAHIIHPVDSETLEYMQLETDTFDMLFEDSVHEAEHIANTLRAANVTANPGAYLICHDVMHFLVGERVRQGITDAGFDDPLLLLIDPADCGLGIVRAVGPPVGEVKWKPSEEIPVEIIEEEPEAPPAWPEEAPNRECTRVPFTYDWIEEGKILIGSIPQYPEDLQSLRELGIQRILSLTRRNFTTYSGLNWDDYFHISIPDGGITTDEIMSAAVEIVNLSINKGIPLYVHCRGGVGRSGIILQAYYVLHRGLSVDEARNKLRIRRNYQGNATAADQGSPQREWLLNIANVSVELDTGPDNDDLELSDLTRAELEHAAKALGIDLETVEGTGKRGYVTKDDLIKALESFGK